MLRETSRAAKPTSAGERDRQTGDDDADDRRDEAHHTEVREDAGSAEPLVGMARTCAPR